MGFVKVIKTKAYFKRYQVKYRRRRECKTDYYARKRLILQDKNKYKSPKYRLVVRISNKDISAQIAAADMDHDVILAHAYAHELPRYGVKVGLTNYAAAYCVGLLIARRVNAKYKLDYEGVEEVDGEDYNVEEEYDEEKNAPFKALLDIGLHRTTTGARLFGVLKGACDGGLNVPHNDRRYPGSGKDGGEWQSNPEIHRKYIFGGHVAEYMEKLKDEDEDAYNKQFKRFIDAGLTADSLEDMYTKAHTEIRADPTRARGNLEKGRFQTRAKAKDKDFVYPKKRWNRARLTVQQRMGRVRQKLLARGVEPIKTSSAI
jgi:large subunit ribosomal protein L5e